MTELDVEEIEKESGDIVHHIIYRVSKKNHDAMLQLCREAHELFRDNGGFHYEVFQLSHTDSPTEGFINIANIVSAKEEEEVWIESLHYRDRSHMNVVVAKMEKDERCNESHKQSLNLLPSGASFIIGEFSRLNV
jgi:uncharacterized protein YbaA (DUF1428 family)